jgi:hypothetical protein
MAVAVDSEVEQRIAIGPGEHDVRPRLRSGRVDVGDADLGDDVPVGREGESRALGSDGEWRSRLAGLAEQGDGGPSVGWFDTARMILVRPCRSTSSRRWVAMESSTLRRRLRFRMSILSPSTGPSKSSVGITPLRRFARVAPGMARGVAIHS